MNVRPISQHTASRHVSVADLAIAIDNAKTGRATASPAHRAHRERDFGIGYGKSSGYADNAGYQRNPSYVSNTAVRLFRFG
ncbi:MAG: hypothetical protein ACOH1P_04515 [Lysobacter sp.]